MKQKNITLEPIVEICEITSLAFKRAEELVKLGYVFDTNNLPQMFHHSNHAAITMILPNVAA